MSAAKLLLKRADIEAMDEKIIAGALNKITEAGAAYRAVVDCGQHEHRRQRHRLQPGCGPGSIRDRHPAGNEPEHPDPQL